MRSAGHLTPQTKCSRVFIDAMQHQALQAVNIALVKRNWLIGFRIAEEELNGENRAEYGLNVMKRLSKELTKIYGKGFTKTNLYSFYSFYKAYPQIFHSTSGKSRGLLSWTHYRCLIQIKDETARSWYEKEAYEQTWSVRTLQRNIDSQYYYRLLASQNPVPVEREMKARRLSLNCSRMKQWNNIQEREDSWKQITKRNRYFQKNYMWRR